MIIDEKLRWYGFWLVDFLKGSPVRKCYKESVYNYKHGTDIRETEEKIRAIIRHAKATTEFYKDIDPETPLDQMPIVNKMTYKEHHSQFMSSTYKDAKDNRVMATSGSTGTPLEVVQDRSKINYCQATGIFLGAVGKYYIGMKQAFIRVWVKQVHKSPLSQLMENIYMMDSSRMDDESLGQMCQFIMKKKVTSLLGYASALEGLSKYIEAQHLDMSKFKVRSIIPISESMSEEARAHMSRQFNCPVRSWYANEENGIMGIQNREDRGYYIDTTNVYYEILKMDSDEPADEGELGRIVITDLRNYAFPIIRYDNGDSAVMQKKVKGGRFKLYLSELYGRRSDLIYDCEGKGLTPYIITNNMWGIQGVDQFRFIQEDAGVYTLLLNGTPESIDEAEIRRRISPYLGEKAQLTVTYVAEIPVLASGKRKYIENRWMN